MWNIVSIGGANYLADVTNCDAETIGVPDKLFLCGVSGDAESGYTAVVGNDKIIYTYDDETKLVYDTELVLSSEAYMPGVYSTEQLTALARYVAGITDVEPQGADVNGDGFVSGPHGVGAQIDCLSGKYAEKCKNFPASILTGWRHRGTMYIVL